MSSLPYYLKNSTAFVCETKKKFFKKIDPKAKLPDTSESWIACIILVLNLVKLAGAALPSQIFEILVSFSARWIKIALTRFAEENRKQLIDINEIFNSNQVELKYVDWV